MDIEEKGRITTTAAQASSWLYFNYTTNCENLVSLFLSFSFPLFYSSRGAPPKCKEIKTSEEQAGRPTTSAL